MNAPSDLTARLNAKAADEDFSGVVRVWNADATIAEFARGFADRANQRPNTTNTRFATASATKGLTALTIMSLIESGELALDTSVRSILGEALPLIDDAVTIDHLLTHRSGIGDYLDEGAGGDIDDHIFGELSAHTLTSPRDYLPLLDGHTSQFLPGAEFAYNNSGFVILSVIIEIITGSFHDAVNDRVLLPASMAGGGFLRSDDLPADTAIGYLEDGRSNVFHLPVIAAGDGGAYLTLDDTTAFWNALQAGLIVSPHSLSQMTAVITDGGDKASYGRGFYLQDGGDHVWLEGMDAGVSFQSGRIESTGLHYTVMSNTSEGVWPLVRLVLAVD